MADYHKEEEKKEGSLIEKVTDKIHGHDSSSSSSSDSEDEKASSYKAKVYRLFGREKPVHKALGGGKRRILNAEGIVAPNLKEKTKAFLAIPESERSCKALLSPESLELSGLWDCLSPIQTDPDMSSRRLPGRADLDLLAKRLDKGKKKNCSARPSGVDTAAEGSGPPPIGLVVAESSRPRKRGVAESTQTDDFDDSISLTFPSNASVFSDPGVLAQLDPLLFPDDLARYKALGPERTIESSLVQSIQTTQAQLYLKQEITIMAKKMKELKDSNTALRRDLEKVTTEKDDYALAMKRVQENLEAEIQRCLSVEEERKIMKAGYEAQIAGHEEDLKMKELDVQIANTAFLMHDFTLGETLKWDPPKAISDYAALCKVLKVRNEITGEMPSEGSDDDKGGNDS